MEKQSILKKKIHLLEKHHYQKVQAENMRMVAGCLVLETNYLEDFKTGFCNIMETFRR